MRAEGCECEGRTVQRHCCQRRRQLICPPLQRSDPISGGVTRVQWSDEGSSGGLQGAQTVGSQGVANQRAAAHLPHGGRRRALAAAAEGGLQSGGQRPPPGVPRGAPRG
eukprot:1194458-Prorocentrum_minimum.AAC.2